MYHYRDLGDDTEQEQAIILFIFLNDPCDDQNETA
jgi:hypothetical protein